MYYIGIVSWSILFMIINYTNSSNGQTVTILFPVSISFIGRYCSNPYPGLPNYNPLLKSEELNCLVSWFTIYNHKQHLIQLKSPIHQSTSITTIHLANWTKGEQQDSLSLPQSIHVLHRLVQYSPGLQLSRLLSYISHGGCNFFLEVQSMNCHRDQHILQYLNTARSMWQGPRGLRQTRQDLELLQITTLRTTAWKHVASEEPNT